MLQVLGLEHYGIVIPPAIVLSIEDESLAEDDRRGAEKETDYDQWAIEVEDGLRRLLADARGFDADSLTVVIEDLEVKEKQLAAARDENNRTIKSAQKIMGDSRRLSAEAGRARFLHGGIRIRNRVAKMNAAALTVLPLLRDARWKLMASRAEGEEPGNAPIFDNPEALGRYLAKL